jgi:hypothetical protein
MLCCPAGVMALNCAGLRAVLGLRITTHQQLARVVVVAADALATMFEGGFANLDPTVGSKYAWAQLKGLYGVSGSSSNTPAWPLDSMSSCMVLARLLTGVVNCFDTSALPTRYHGYHQKVSARISNALGSCTSRAAASSSGSSSQQPPANSTTTTTSAGSTAIPASIPAQQRLPDMTLPLDDCGLLMQHYSSLGLVLRCVTAWVERGTPDNMLLRVGIWQHLTAELTAASNNNNSSSQVVSDGPRRRTLLPAQPPATTLPLSNLDAFVDSQLTGIFSNPGAWDKMMAHTVHKPTAELVCGVARQVAKELSITQGSAGYSALIQATVNAGEVGEVSTMFAAMPLRHRCRPHAGHFVLQPQVPEVMSSD